MKDYLKHCSNLDEDEYASLWEDYELEEETWVDKISDLWFDIQWSIYMFFRNLKRKKKKRWKS